jgi:hypothetical protein
VYGLEGDLRTGFFLGDERALEKGETFGFVGVVMCHFWVRIEIEIDTLVLVRRSRGRCRSVDQVVQNQSRKDSTLNSSDRSTRHKKLDQEQEILEFLEKAWWKEEDRREGLFVFFLVAFHLALLRA